MLLDLLRPRLEPLGLNLYGVVGAARFDAAAPAALRTSVVHPGTRSIVVVGSGGTALFDAFLAYVAGDPVERLARRAHPLDAWCVEVFSSLGALTAGCRVVYPTWFTDVPLDFVRTAELAGLGRASELGILVNAAFGPWFGLRAAIFTPESLPEDPIAARLCDGCAAPCHTPATALARRLACVVAPAQAYVELQRLYHYDRLAGRRALCARFRVADEIAGPVY